MAPDQQSLFFVGGRKFTIDSSLNLGSNVTIEKDPISKRITLNVKFTLVEADEEMISTYDEIIRKYKTIDEVKNFVFVQSKNSENDGLEMNRVLGGSINLVTNDDENAEMNINLEILGGKTQHPF